MSMMYQYLKANVNFCKRNNLVRIRNFANFYRAKNLEGRDFSRYCWRNFMNSAKLQAGKKSYIAAYGTDAKGSFMERKIPGMMSLLQFPSALHRILGSLGAHIPGLTIPYIYYGQFNTW